MKRKLVLVEQISHTWLKHSCEDLISKNEHRVPDDEHAHSNPLIEENLGKPVVMVDHCLTPVKFDGIELWIQVPLSRGLEKSAELKSQSID
jgi:hypothetical protein